MESLYLIAPVATIFCVIAVIAWLWAAQDGQYDDLDREARRILEEDPVPPATKTTQHPTNHND